MLNLLNVLNNLIKNNLKVITIIIFFAPILSLIYFGIVPINSKNPNNIIGLLIQTEAAVIAVIVSLTLVAIQLAAQTYSARVIGIIRGNKLFLSVISSYIFTIIYGIALVIVIDNSNNSLIIPYLILIEYYISIWLFIALVPLFISILNSLKPSRMIDMLIGGINNKKLKNAFVKKEKASKKREDKKNKLDSEMEFLNYKQIMKIKPNIRADEEPIQPVIDIIQSSIIKNDFETITHGLKKLDYETIKVVNHLQNNEDKEIILNLMLTYLTRLGIQAIERENEDVIIEIVELMNKFTRIAIIKSLTDPLILSADSYSKICGISIKKGLENPSGILSYSLGNVGQSASKKKIKHLTIRTTNSLIKIGRSAITLDFDDSVFSTTNSIGKMVKNAPKSFKIRIISINYIGEAGKYFINKQNDQFSKYVLIRLQNIGLNTTKDDDLLSLNEVSKNLLDISNITLEQKSNELTLYCGNILIKIAISCIVNGLEEEVIKIQSKVAEIAKKSIESKFNFIEYVFSEELLKIGIVANDNERIIKTIREIPIISEKIEFKVIFDRIERYKKFSSTKIMNEVMESVINISKATSEKKDDFTTRLIIDLICKVYKNNNISSLLWSNKLGDLGEIGIKNSLYSSTNAIIDLIFLITNKRLNQLDSGMIIFAINKLDKISKIAIEKEEKSDNSYDKDKIREIYNKIIDSLMKIAKIGIQKQNDEVPNVLISLGNIGKIAANHQHNDILKKVIESAKYMGDLCIVLNLPFSLNMIAYIFGSIGEITIKNQVRNIPIRSINFFYDNIESIIEMEADIALQWAIYSLKSIGKIATEKRYLTIIFKSLQLSEITGGFLLEKIYNNEINQKNSDNEITNFVKLLYYLLDIGKSAFDLADFNTVYVVKKIFKKFLVILDYYKFEKFKEIIKKYILELEELEKKM